MKSNSQHIGHAYVYENSGGARRQPCLVLNSLELDIYTISVSFSLQKKNVCDLGLSLFSTMPKECTIAYLLRILEDDLFLFIFYLSFEY